MNKRRNNRRNRRNQGPAYKCVGVVVKNPNANNPLGSSSLADLIGAFAKTLPKKPVYSFESLMEMKKQELLNIASKEGVKVWKAWNKTKIPNAILGDNY